MAITTAISDFFASIYELFASVFGAAYSLIHSVFSAVVGFITGIFSLFGDLLSGVADIAGGIGKFLLGNIVVIALVAAGVFGYMRYTAQGRQLAAGKKAN